MKTTTNQLVQFAKDILDVVVSNDRTDICVKMKRNQEWQVIVKVEEMEIFIYENQSLAYNQWVVSMIRKLILEGKWDGNIKRAIEWSVKQRNIRN